LWQAIHYLLNLKMKLKYVMQLRRSSYLKVLSLEEWNVSDDAEQQVRQDLETCEFI